ncbi:MAG: restriction endonuclease, SacI family [Phycisphaerae bacterium]
MPRERRSPLLVDARRILAERWSVRPTEGSRLTEAVRQAIERCTNSKTKSNRYVLPTQLLAKLADPNLDCRCVQADSSRPGSFDARSLCHGVIVPFDRENHAVLGGSTEPYVNNPLRISAIGPPAREAQRDKVTFDDLCSVLDYAQAHPNATAALFDAVLDAVRTRLEQTQIEYAVPHRVSLLGAVDSVRRFVATRSGGARLQSVSIALFRTIGRHFGLFATVDSHHVNAADASTGSVADLQCRGDDGNIVLAVEVKDRTLTLRHIQDAVGRMRSKAIRDLLFLVQGGVAGDDRERAAGLTSSEFASGQNVYVVDFFEFVTPCCVLLREAGRRDLLVEIGESLTDYHDRRDWQARLQAL